MDLLLTKTPKEAVQFHVLPMVFQALEAPSEQVQVSYHQVLHVQFRLLFLSND